MSDAKAQVTSQVTAAVATTVANPNVPASIEAVPAIVNALGPLIDAIVHSTNNEPWYQSRTVWGQVLVIIGIILGLFGVSFPAEIQNQVLVVITAVLPIVSGVAVTLYGRFVAKKPLGS